MTIDCFNSVQLRGALISYSISVRRSVCLSVTRRYCYCIKTNERRMTPSSLLGSPLTLIAFGNIKFINIISTGPPIARALNETGVSLRGDFLINKSQ